MGAGTTTNTSKSYGATSAVYTNINYDTATGFVYNSRFRIVVLELGTYSQHLQGAVFAGNLVPEAAFGVTFGDMDRLDINAIYL